MNLHWQRLQWIISEGAVELDDGRKSFVFGTGNGLTEDEVRMRDTSDFEDVLLFCAPFEASR